MEGILTMEPKKQREAAARQRRLHRESEISQKQLDIITGIKEQHPSWESRRTTAWIRKQDGLSINHKHILRLVRLGGLPASRNLRLRAPRRNAEKTRGKPMVIESSRYWGTEITRIMLPRSGWAYLHIVIDWGDNKLLADHLSHTSKSSSWIEALEQAVSVEFSRGIRDLSSDCQPPELMSAHASQPTSAAFRSVCDTLGINHKLREAMRQCGHGEDDADDQGGPDYPSDCQTCNELETEQRTWMKPYNEEFLQSTLGYDTLLECEEWCYVATTRSPSLTWPLEIFWRILAS